MPTKVPRVNVCVTEEQHALLHEMAQLEGMSASRVVRSLLDRMTPFLRMTVPLLRQAQENKQLAQVDADRIIGQAFREAVEVTQMDIFDDAGTGSAARAPRSERERARPARTAEAGPPAADNANG